MASYIEENEKMEKEEILLKSKGKEEDGREEKLKTKKAEKHKVEGKKTDDKHIKCNEELEARENEDRGGKLKVDKDKKKKKEKQEESDARVSENLVEKSASIEQVDEEREGVEKDEKGREKKKTKEDKEDKKRKEKGEKGKTKDISKLKQRLEKIDAKMEALLAKKSDILKQIQEAEECALKQNRDDDGILGEKQAVVNENLEAVNKDDHATRDEAA